MSPSSSFLIFFIFFSFCLDCHQCHLSGCIIIYPLISNFNSASLSPSLSVSKSFYPIRLVVVISLVDFMPRPSAFLFPSPDPVLDFSDSTLPLLNAMDPVCSYRSRWTARVVMIRLGVRLAARLMSVYVTYVACASNSSLSDLLD